MNWYRRHRVPSDHKLAMKRWDEIWTECPKPLGQHQEELMALMIRWELLSVNECRTILGLEQSEILKIEQMAKSKTVTKILRLDKDSENDENDGNDDNEMNRAKTVNSMFGMQMDSDSDSQSAADGETECKPGPSSIEDANWKPGPPSIQRMRRCDAKNRRLEQKKRTYSNRNGHRVIQSKRTNVGTVWIR